MQSKKIVYVDASTMNKHLDYVKKYRSIKYEEPNDMIPVVLDAYIENKETWFNLTYKCGPHVCTYKFKKDNSGECQCTDGGEAFRILSQYYKIPRIKDADSIGSAKPILYKNPKYENKRTKAISYDINSAYSNAMLMPMPDTSVKFRTGYVEDGEIGFRDGSRGLEAVFSGYCLWIYPLMESPFKRFVERWYEAKKNGNPKAKGVLNYSVGYLQRMNPFLRATIITYCNNIIQSIIDKYDDIIYCNTDAIVTETIKPELPIGNGIGEWKIEKTGVFAFVGYNYQWNKEPPHYRGKCRNWFPPGWDILKDKLPMQGNEYEYNNIKIKLEKTK